MDVLSERISRLFSGAEVYSVEEAGRSRVCPGETVVFTCSIQATALLEWWTGPPDVRHVQLVPWLIGITDGSDDIEVFQAVSLKPTSAVIIPTPYSLYSGSLLLTWSMAQL